MPTSGYSRWTAVVLALLALTLEPGRAAVTWTTIECDDVNIDGQTIDNIWDNAKLLASNAEKTVDSMVGSIGQIKPVTLNSRRANNAHWIFGIDVNRLIGLPSASKATLRDSVKPVYAAVQQLMQSNNGYMICGGKTAKLGPAGSSPFAWHYDLPDGNVLVLDGIATFESQRPCTLPPIPPPTPDNPNPKRRAVKIGEMFDGAIFPAGANNGQPGAPVKAVLVCTDLMQQGQYPGTLSLNFNADWPSVDFPDPDGFGSISSTLMHEMVHAVDRSKYIDVKSTTLFNDDKAAYGFWRCSVLAEKQQSSALVNADSFTMFAQMSMSPLTRWGAPRPDELPAPAPVPPAQEAPEAGAAAGQKRSIFERAAPRLSMAERRAQGLQLGAIFGMDYVSDQLEWSS